MIILFVFFLYIVYLTTLFIGKTNKRYSFSKNIKIIEKVSISNGIFLMIIELNSKYYLISVAKDKVELIDTMNDLNVVQNEVNENKFGDIFMSKIRNSIKKEK
jgi:flagellar biogenesis protein FliO